MSSEYTGKSTPLTPFRRSLLCHPGYRCRGPGKRWVAQYSPLTNLVQTDPWCPKRMVNRVLPEEFVHATTVGYRPAQLYPLANYLMEVDNYPDVEEFRELVEAVYVAMWPLAKDKPITVRSLPQAEGPERAAAEHILELAHQFAGAAGNGLSTADARRQALWAVTMFLLYVVPLTPGQCPIVLHHLARISPPKPWRTYPDLFQHLFAEMAAAQAAPPASGPRTFQLVPPSEPHRNVAVTLELTRHILQLPPDALLPVFPAALSIVTLHTTNIIPLVWLRASDRCVHAAVELWDQTGQRLDAVTSVISERRRLHRKGSSPIKDCPTDRFYREATRTIARTLMRRRPCRPAQIMGLAFETLRTLIRKYLMRMLQHDSTPCPWCQRLVCTPSVKEAAKQILATPLSRVRLLAAETEGYERWLLSGGLSIIESQLHERLGLDLPVVPALTREGRTIMGWRSL
jgi:hypothetical protein